ncbi:hypothetical protein [uncultured Pluralibacter sp.]|uniref:hypothetical protein n=1 Tax=uncultured Pluralibacter sp. TaxID=1490864 RepID=UPI00263112BA|nr:hypothetical protein [uncultured Pluralibacter sp.]
MVKPETGLLDTVAHNTWMFSLTSIVLVFVGWAVTYNNSVKLATRSESKSLVDSLCKLIHEISDISIEYWLNKSHKQKNINRKNGIRQTVKHFDDGTQSRLFVMNVFAKMNQSVKYIELLDGRGIHIDKSVFPLFLSKVTLDCEKSISLSPQERAARVQEILAYSQESMNHIYTVFQNHHRPSKPLRPLYFMRQKWKEIEKWYDDLG